tara:strand:- start:4781 stop:6076 length:1296 start_codon:yes stop_codon:yes gene_type:complete
MGVNMRIGLVGKPNVGKSTTFSALTETPVDIANYPFTTIDPNVGIAWLPLRENCACKILREKKEQQGRMPKVVSNDSRKGSICNPKSGSCRGYKRLVPVTLVDVAGLVPGAHEGRGRGNQFLSDLAQCDALIQVIDISGSTDIEGNPVGDGGSKPVEEYNFLKNEIDAWIVGIIQSNWSRGARRVQSEGEKALSKFLIEQLSGIGVTEYHVNAGILSVKEKHPDCGVPWSWGNDELMTMAAAIRSLLFPISVAGNKADKNKNSELELSSIVKSQGGKLILTSAEAELALRRASKSGLIELNPDTSDFSITNMGEKSLSRAQRDALANISQTLAGLPGGGLLGLLSSVVFDRLNRSVAYPVQDDSHWTDGEGNILPDAVLVSEGTTAKQLAYTVHSDLGDGFIRATDAKSGRVIGAEYQIQNGDVISIHAKK